MAILPACEGPPGSGRPEPARALPRSERPFRREGTAHGFDQPEPARRQPRRPDRRRRHRAHPCGRQEDRNLLFLHRGHHRRLRGDAADERPGGRQCRHALVPERQRQPQERRDRRGSGGATLLPGLRAFRLPHPHRPGPHHHRPRSHQGAVEADPQDLVHRGRKRSAHHRHRRRPLGRLLLGQQARRRGGRGEDDDRRGPSARRSTIRSRASSRSSSWALRSWAVARARCTGRRRRPGRSRAAGRSARRRRRW